MAVLHLRRSFGSYSHMFAFFLHCQVGSEMVRYMHLVCAFVKQNVSGIVVTSTCSDS